MDKESYLKIKGERKKSEILYSRENFCFKCVRLLKNCLCPLIHPFHTDIHFVLLLHPMEAKKEKMGTGKISQLSLINSEIIIGIDFTSNEQVNALISDPKNYCLVLYPGKNSLNISKDNVEPLIAKKVNDARLVVFLIDGTWPCAKKMMKLSVNLNTLPRISFTATHTSIFEIKEQPADFCLSTLESIHFFLQECNRRGLEETLGQENHMITVFKEMINFQIQCSLDPNLSSYTKGVLGYSKKEDRIRAKKWVTRNIVLP